MSDEQHNEKKGVNVTPSDLPIPDELPVLPIHGFVFFPGMGFPLHLSSVPSKQLIDDALLSDRLVAIVTHKKIEHPTKVMDTATLYSVGVLGYIHKMIKSQDGAYQILTSGVRKIRVLEFTQLEPYHRARVEPLEMNEESDREMEALLHNLRSQFKRLIELSNLAPELNLTLISTQNPFFVAYLVVSQLNLSLAEEQEFLEIEELKELLHRTTRKLNDHMETVEMGHEIQKNVQENVDKQQREFYLRQQLKAIRKELGEDEDQNVEFEELKQKMAEAALSKEAKKTAEKELGRLSRIPPSSPEYTVSRNYLEWLLDLPWEFVTTDSLDIELARKHLDEDHYGLEKIKKRIIEFLAVRKLKQDIQGPILCFIGPPGVGKTSLGQSIARTMDRKFVRISLGGMRDEAEIRGHRRTYIGSLPGRIINSIRKAGTKNPLFMLDEIDKLGMDFRGDPSSALLEVLDPEQNSTFVDHYLEIPFDLSKVMFITTANVIENIPIPLRDRMEIIELSGYTEDEKLGIAKQFLIGKQLEAHGLTDGDLRIDDEAVRTIIHSYTREAGVRNLERQIAAICRGVAKEIVSGHEGIFEVGTEDLEDFLGPVRFFSEISTRSWGPGLATGLAWTPVGGQLIFIETAKMPGKGSLVLTGQLGDVMKESANAALTCVRSHYDEIGIKEADFLKTDIHVHIPAGATPKDGPSAGVAIAVSLVSLFTGKPVRKDLAMTGEITLRGDVLPVGGIKEKVLAAKQAGINEVVIPFQNEKDLTEIPDHVRKGLNFHHVQKVTQVLALAFSE